jgi:hypothetical protein
MPHWIFTGCKEKKNEENTDCEKQIPCRTNSGQLEMLIVHLGRVILKVHNHYYS